MWGGVWNWNVSLRGAIRGCKAELARRGETLQECFTKYGSSSKAAEEKKQHTTGITAGAFGNPTQPEYIYPTDTVKAVLGPCFLFPFLPIPFILFPSSPFSFSLLLFPFLLFLFCFFFSVFCFLLFFFCFFPSAFPLSLAINYGTTTGHIFE